MNISNFIGSTEWLHFSKPLCRILKDANTTLVLTNLVDKRQYFLNKDMLKKINEPFYLTQKDMTEELGLSTEVIQTSIKKLIKINFLIFEGRKGIPSRNYYRINDTLIYRTIIKNG